MTELINFEDKPVIAITQLCEMILPLPKNSVLFGMAEEKPILFSVTNKETPNTIVWDRLAGQGLRLIKTAIEFILRFHVGKKLEFVVMSNHTKEWERLNENGLGVWSKNECIAIVPFWDVVADQVLFGMAKWVQEAMIANSPVILFVDGLENLGKMSEESQRWFHFISMYGRRKNIYVVVTAKSESRVAMNKWTEGFQAEIFGHNKIEWFEMDEKHGTTVFFTPNTSI